MQDLRKIQRKMGKLCAKFNVKYIRLAFNALNLCNIYAMFNTKIKIYAKFTASKIVRLALNALILSMSYAQALMLHKFKAFNANLT